MGWRQSFSKRPAAISTVAEGQSEETLTAGGKYIGEIGGNNAPPTYQDASGAPVESKSPLGYSVGPVTITLLNVTMMIGAGIYSTRECDTAHAYLEMPANITKHHLSCPVRARSAPVSCFGPSVTWYISSIIGKQHLLIVLAPP